MCNLPSRVRIVGRVFARANSSRTALGDLPFDAPLDLFQKQKRSTSNSYSRSNACGFPHFYLPFSGHGSPSGKQTALLLTPFEFYQGTPLPLCAFMRIRDARCECADRGIAWELSSGTAGRVLWGWGEVKYSSIKPNC